MSFIYFGMYHGYRHFASLVYLVYLIGLLVLNAFILGGMGDSKCVGHWQPLPLGRLALLRHAAGARGGLVRSGGGGVRARARALDSPLRASAQK